MMKIKSVLVSVFAVLLLAATGCQEKKKESAAPKVSVTTSLFDKELAEIKELVNGKWELVSSQNARETSQYENTFIEISGDNYVWTEEGESESGKMNWRKADTGAGYQSYLMDLFYAEHPAYPLAIKGDTLYIQDCSATAYKYMLLRK